SRSGSSTRPGPRATRPRTRSRSRRPEPRRAVPFSARRLIKWPPAHPRVPQGAARGREAVLSMLVTALVTPFRGEGAALDEGERARLLDAALQAARPEQILCALGAGRPAELVARGRQALER